MNRKNDPNFLLICFLQCNPPPYKKTNREKRIMRPRSPGSLSIFVCAWAARGSKTKMAAGGAEEHFAKKLANNEKKIRDRAVNKLRAWIRSRPKDGLGKLVYWKNLRTLGQGAMIDIKRSFFDTYVLVVLICCNNFMHCLFIAFEVASGLAAFLVFKVLVS